MSDDSGFLSLAQAQEYLDRFEFGMFEDFCLRVIPHSSPAPAIFISFTVPNAYSEQAEPITIGCKEFLRSEKFTCQDLHKVVRFLVQRAVMHEMHEHLRFDGVLLYDPHADDLL